MAPRKSVNPDALWDWEKIAERVQQEFERAKARSGGTLTQTEFGRPFGFSQGAVSKLINRRFFEPSIKLEKGLTAMLGTKVMRTLTELPAPELGEIGRIARLALREDPLPADRARPVQDKGHPFQILITEVDGVPLTHEEQAICFPLLRALVALLRNNERALAHLLEQTRWALNIAGDGDNGHLREAIDTFERIKGYSIVPGPQLLPRRADAGDQQSVSGSKRGKRRG